MALKGELFSQDMVRALLEGRKLHTARPVKKKYDNAHFEYRTDKYGTEFVEMQNDVEGKTFGKNSDGTTWHKLRGYIISKPKYRPKDFMYCRETWQEVFETEYDKDAVGHCVNIRTVIPNFDDIPKTCMGLSTRESCQSMQPRNRYYVYKSSNIKYADPDYVLRWRPSIHMPREAARLFYRVTKVEAMNLNDVDEQFAQEDGFEADEMGSALDKFKRFWLDTYGSATRWMWVYWMERCSKEEAWND